MESPIATAGIEPAIIEENEAAPGDSYAPASGGEWANANGGFVMLSEMAGEEPAPPSLHSSGIERPPGSETIRVGFLMDQAVEDGMRSFYRREARKMSRDFSGWLNGLDESARKLFDARFAAMPENERRAEQQKLTSIHFVAAETGINPLTLNANWPAFSNAYAQLRGGEWRRTIGNTAALSAKIQQEMAQADHEEILISGPIDEMPKPEEVGFWSGLFGGKDKAQGKIQPQQDAWEKTRRDSLMFRAEEAARNDERSMGRFLEWADMAKEKQGYDQGHYMEYYGAWKEAYDAEAVIAAKVRPVAEKVHDLIARDLTGKPGGDSSPAYLLRDFTPKEKYLAFTMMAKKAGVLGEKRDVNYLEFQSFFETMGRSFKNLGSRSGAEAWDSQLRITFKEGSLVTEDDAVAEASKNFHRYVAARASSGTASGFAMLSTSKKERRLSAADAVNWNERLAMARRDLETSMILERFGQDVIDPPAGGPFYKDYVHPFAESIGTTTVLAVPHAWVVGLDAVARSYKYDDYLRRREAGMPEDEAYRLSGPTAFGQALLDKLQVGIAKGFGQKWLPRTTHALRKFTLSGNRLARFGVNFGGTLVAQSGIEQIQDFVIPAMVQDIMTHDPEYDIEWGPHLYEAIAQLPATMRGMVFLSLLGSSYQTAAQGRIAQDLSSNRGAMALLNYKEAQIAEIQAADMAQRRALLAKYLPRKAPVGEDRKRAIALAVRYATEDQAALAEMQRAVEGEQVGPAEESTNETGSRESERGTSGETLSLEERQDPRIREEFRGWKHGFDADGLPLPPRTLPDGHKLLEPTASRRADGSVDFKPTAVIDDSHPLVQAGLLTPGTHARADLHQAIIAYFLKDKAPLPRGTQPRMIVTAGGGGAGKSSVLAPLGITPENLPNAVWVDADAIKKLIPEFEALAREGDGSGAAMTHVESSELSQRLLDLVTDPRRQQRFDVVFDSTMSRGEGDRAWLRKQKENGFTVRMYAVTIDLEEAMVRAAIRARKSTRWVPTQVLRDAHAGFNRELQSYADIVDAWELWDNSVPNSKPRRIAIRKSGKIDIEDQAVYRRFYERRKESARSLPAWRADRHPGDH